MNHSEVPAVALYWTQSVSVAIYTFIFLLYVPKKSTLALANTYVECFLKTAIFHIISAWKFMAKTHLRSYKCLLFLLWHIIRFYCLLYTFFTITSKSHWVFFYSLPSVSKYRLMCDDPIIFTYNFVIRKLNMAIFFLFIHLYRLIEMFAGNSKYIEFLIEN